MVRKSCIIIYLFLISNGSQFSNKLPLELVYKWKSLVGLPIKKRDDLIVKQWNTVGKCQISHQLNARHNPALPLVPGHGPQPPYHTTPEESSLIRGHLLQKMTANITIAFMESGMIFDAPKLEIKEIPRAKLLDTWYASLCLGKIPVIYFHHSCSPRYSSLDPQGSHNMENCKPKPHSQVFLSPDR